MNSSEHEQLSTLVDKELDVHEAKLLIDDLKNNKELMGRWESYHLIGDILRNNQPEILMPKLADQIKQTIDNEPFLQQNHPVILKFKSAISRMPANLAIAASVMAVAVIGLLQANFTPQVENQQFITATFVNDAVESKVVNPISVASVAEKAPDQQVMPINDNQADIERLNSYLVEHNESSFVTPVRGAMMPYVRLVGYSRD
ncbi:MAG: sigma-E factor negative regulatory protein [Gammaproteobacteria bacterium]